MDPKQTETAGILTHLINLCTDGAEGYRHAARSIDDPRVHRVLVENAARRDEIAAVLTSAVVARGQRPGHQASLEGRAHRAWLDTIAALRPNSTHAILRECARGEGETMDAFAEALALQLDDDARNLLQSELGRILDAIAELNRVANDLDARARVAS
jgi:uncharacterized protein (TIGR02284 family)